MSENDNNTGTVIVAIVAILAVVLVVAVALRLFQGQTQNPSVLPDINIGTNSSGSY